jgi:hypothetical protein
VSGGATLPIEQAPYVAWLGGRCLDVISPTRILTAGHCQTAGPRATSCCSSASTANCSPSSGTRWRSPSPATVDRTFKESFPFAHDNPSNAIAIDDVGLILLRRRSTIKPVRVAGAGDGLQARACEPR